MRLNQKTHDQKRNVHQKEIHQEIDHVNAPMKEIDKGWHTSLVMEHGRIPAETNRSANESAKGPRESRMGRIRKAEGEKKAKTMP